MSEGQRFPAITILLGVGRSGTSYMTTMLRRKLRIGFPGEPKFVIPIYRKLRRFGPLDDPGNLRRLAETVHRYAVFQDYLHKAMKIPSSTDELLERVVEPTYSGVLYATFQLIADKLGYPRLGYKDPADTAHLQVLAELFPTARFVHIIRDGRAVALSNLKMNWGHTNVYEGARTWGRDLQQVTDFVDEIVRTNSPATAQAWEEKMTERQRYLCEAAAGDVLRVCGYPTEFKDARVSTLFGACLSTQDFLGRARARLARGHWLKI